MKSKLEGFNSPQFFSSGLGSSLISSAPSSCKPKVDRIMNNINTANTPCQENKHDHDYYLHIGGPESEIVTKKLHDQSAILVRLLSQCIQLSNCFIKGLFHRKNMGYQKKDTFFCSWDAYERTKGVDKSKITYKSKITWKLKTSDRYGDCLTCLARLQARSGEFKIS